MTALPEATICWKHNRRHVELAAYSPTQLAVALDSNLAKMFLYEPLPPIDELSFQVNAAAIELIRRWAEEHPMREFNPDYPTWTEAIAGERYHNVRLVRI